MPITNRKKGNQPKVFIGIINDAGGYIITFDRNGGIHIKPVPPWQPDIERIGVISNLLSQARKVKDRATRKQLQEAAQQLAAELAPALNARFGG